MLRAARSAAGLLGLTLGLLLGCRGGAGAPPPMPESAIQFRPHEEHAPLDRAPYDQPFAWVPPSAIFAGLYPQDDSVTDARLYEALKASVRLPLEAVGWYEVPADSARYFVTVLLADRAVFADRSERRDFLDDFPGGTSQPRDFEGRRRVPREEEREARARALAINDVAIGRTYRAYAISSRDRRTHYRVMWSDRWTVEAAFTADVIDLVLGKAP